MARHYYCSGTQKDTCNGEEKDMAFKVTKQYRTETAHRLTGYFGKCAHLHGHSYLWEVTVVKDELDEHGFVIDFKNIKAAMSKVLEPFDHALVLHKDDKLLEAGAHQMRLLFNATSGEDGRLIILAHNPTAENFAKFAGINIQRELGQEYIVACVTVWETTTCYATWAP